MIECRFELRMKVVTGTGLMVCQETRGTADLKPNPNVSN